jgi:hypothetical protein
VALVAPGAPAAVEASPATLREAAGPNLQSQSCGQPRNTPGVAQKGRYFPEDLENYDPMLRYALEWQLEATGPATVNSGRSAGSERAANRGSVLRGHRRLAALDAPDPSSGTSRAFFRRFRS